MNCTGFVLDHLSTSVVLLNVIWHVVNYTDTEYSGTISFLLIFEFIYCI